VPFPLPRRFPFPTELSPLETASTRFHRLPALMATGRAPPP
jgi:hypothetical protein